MVKEKKKLITTKLDPDVHLMLKLLVKRYRKAGKAKLGKISLSRAAGLFIEENDPTLAETARRQAEEQEELLGDDEDADEE